MRGQNLRLALKGDNDASKKYIAGAISFDLDLQCDTEENTTKDSTGGWKQYEATLKSWSGSGQCRLAKDAADTAAVQGWDIFDLVGVSLEASFDETDGTMNRNTVLPRKRGTVIITGWKVSAASGSIVNVDFNFQGVGQLANAAPYITGADEVILTATNAAKSGTYVASDSQAITATKETAATWLTVSVNSNTVTFTPTAYAHAASGDDPRVARVTIATSTGASKVVLVKQPMAAS